MKTARYYLLRIKKRVSNTAQLPTKPDQVAEAERFNVGGKTNIKFETSQKPKGKQNKEVKTRILAELQKSSNNLVTYFI